MKKLILIVSLFILLVGTTTSCKRDIKEDNITYIKDTRTGLCFSVIESRPGKIINSIGVVLVPCDCIKKNKENK